MVYEHMDADGDAIRVTETTVATKTRGGRRTDVYLPDQAGARVAMASVIVRGTGAIVATQEDTDRAAAEAWERGAEAMRRVAAYYLDTVQLDTYADAVRALPTPPPGATADPAAVLCGAPDGEGVCGFPAESRPCPVHDTPAGRAALSDDELAAVRAMVRTVSDGTRTADRAVAGYAPWLVDEIDRLRAENARLQARAASGPEGSAS